MILPLNFHRTGGDPLEIYPLERRGSGFGGQGGSWFNRVFKASSYAGTENLVMPEGSSFHPLPSGKPEKRPKKQARARGSYLRTKEKDLRTPTAVLVEKEQDREHRTLDKKGGG